MDQTRISIECVEEGCDAKVRNIKRHIKVHIASAQTGGTRYICQLENCNFETHSKRYLVKHMNRCKFKDSESLKTIESVSEDIKTSGREDDKSEHHL